MDADGVEGRAVTRAGRAGLGAMMRAATLVVAACVAAPLTAVAQDTIDLGMTVPMSGAGASWGLGSEWVAKQAVQYVNDHGGVNVGGKRYKFAVTAYDNKYTATEGVKVAQTMLNRDGVKFIVLGMSTQAVVATQGISERAGVPLFSISWAASTKGPKYPLTFTPMNTPTEFLGPLYDVVKQRHPGIRKVVLIRPNDSVDQEVANAAAAHWKRLGVEVVGDITYERGTTEFQPVATKAAQLRPDAIDSLGAPPGDVGVLYRALADAGWSGVRVASAGSVSDAVIKTGGPALEGLYMGLGAVFSGPTATPLQRSLDAQFEPQFHEPLNLTHMSSWDSIMALKAGLEKAGKIDGRAVAQALPLVTFESSYGPASFGGAKVYGSPQQILLPVIVTQIQGGKIVEVTRVPSAEQAERLASRK